MGSSLSTLALSSMPLPGSSYLLRSLLSLHRLFLSHRHRFLSSLSPVDHALIQCARTAWFTNTIAVNVFYYRFCDQKHAEPIINALQTFGIIGPPSPSVSVSAAPSPTHSLLSRLSSNFYSLLSLSHIVHDKSDSRPRFPATISFTIRRGVPYAVYHLLWATGWCFMLSVLVRRGSPLLLLFSLQLLVKGFITTGVCPINRGGACGIDSWYNRVHMMCAMLCIADQLLLFRLFNVKPVYERAFIVSLIVLVLAFAVAREADWNEEDDNGEDSQDRESDIDAYDNDKSNVNTDASADDNVNVSRLTRLKGLIRYSASLLVMICENIVFATFVAGMTSGIRNLEN